MMSAFSIVDSRCEMTNVVLPASRRSSPWNTSRFDSESSPELGSSRIRIPASRWCDVRGEREGRGEGRGGSRDV